MFFIKKKGNKSEYNSIMALAKVSVHLLVNTVQKRIEGSLSYC